MCVSSPCCIVTRLLVLLPVFTSLMFALCVFVSMLYCNKTAGWRRTHIEQTSNYWILGVIPAILLQYNMETNTQRANIKLVNTGSNTICWNKRECYIHLYPGIFHFTENKTQNPFDIIINSYIYVRQTTSASTSSFCHYSAIKTMRGFPLQYKGTLLITTS
jgi:hypothetical protein